MASEDKYLYFSLSIEQIAKDLQRLKNERMKKYDLRSVHTTCLIKIGQSAYGLTCTQLSQYCRVDKSLISRMLHELLSKGFVKYEESEFKYRRRIILTDKGEEVLDELRSMLNEIISRISGTVNMEDVKAFYRVLEALDEQLVIETGAAGGSEEDLWQK